MTFVRRKIFTSLAWLKISKEKLSEMTSLFTRLDANHDGYLHLPELRLGLEKYFSETGSLGKDDWNTLFANFDLDGNGMIGFDDWIAVVEDREAILSKDNIANIF